MNEVGLTVTINAAKSSIPTSAATPISILTREILQYASNLEEAYKIAESRNLFVSESILIGSAKDGRAAIIEKSPDKTAFYESERDYIVSTNHFQSDAFKEDSRNLENIRKSDSKYRLLRLEELVGERFPLDEHKSAEILRNFTGLRDRDIGLTNPKSINQFLAHHSVIFMPEKLIMWVSTDPWQNGKYVAYDLNKIFYENTILEKGERVMSIDSLAEVADRVNFSEEIYSVELNIPEDGFGSSPEYINLINYKRLYSYIEEYIEKQSVVKTDSLNLFERTNGEYYQMYELLGDYYLSIKETTNAVIHWKIALTKEAPYMSDKERIERKIKKYDK